MIGFSFLFRRFLLLRCLMYLPWMGILLGSLSAPSAGAQVVLELKPSPTNPRNSEGDFVVLRDGRILFVYTHFTGGGSDHDQAYLAGRESRDGGISWSPQDRLILKEEGGMNIMSVSLLRLVDGRIALFYMRKKSLQDCRPVVRFSSDEAVTWSEAVSIIPDRDTGYFVLNNDRVVALSDGRLVAPVALHHRPDWKAPDWKGEIGCYVSTDGGNHWELSSPLRQVVAPTGSRILAQEPGVVELQDGRVMLWVRTDQGGIYRSYSRDLSQWTPFEGMGLAAPRSPASLERIPGTGELLILWNNHAHLPPSERKNRTPLTLALSRDEGRTWGLIRDLEKDPNGWYCYTAMEVYQGQLLLAYCAGDRRTGGLNLTRIRRLPIASLHEP